MPTLTWAEWEAAGDALVAAGAAEVRLTTAPDMGLAGLAMRWPGVRRWHLPAPVPARFRPLA